MTAIDPSRVFWLSHPLDQSTPAYGGGPGLETEQLTSIAGGDTANTLSVSFPNHLGTHVDTPAHFFDGGRDLLSYEPGDWVFSRPRLVDVEAGDGDLVAPDHLADPIPQGCDLLLIRTGHGEYRGEDRYWQKGPGLSPELGRWLRERHPSIRAVGMDLISVTTRLDRDAGRAAHRAFLDPDAPGEPIRLIEDMDLIGCPKELTLVLASPLPLQDADGGPVTVWAFE